MQVRRLGKSITGFNEKEHAVRRSEVLALYDQDRKYVVIFGMRREETQHVVRHICADGAGLVIYSDIDAVNGDKVIGDQAAHFQGRGCDVKWIVHQHDLPGGLKRRLQAHGFQGDEPDAVLVLELQEAPAALLEPVRRDVRRIEQPSQLDDVITIHEQVWQCGFESWRARLSERLVEAPESLSLYVAYVDGRPASTKQVSFYAGRPFGSLVRAATLGGFRGRGLFSALVAMLVQETKKRSVRFLDTDAGAMSRPILEKLGFRWLTTAQSFSLRAGAAQTAS